MLLVESIIQCPVLVTNSMASQPTLLTVEFWPNALFLMVRGLYFLSELIFIDLFYFSLDHIDGFQCTTMSHGF